MNRGKNGIRVKALRDFGYNNYADIYQDSAAHICLVQGISAYTANEVKHTVDQFAESIRAQVKIRINTDDRNPLATKVLCLLYKYLKYPAIREKVKDIVGNSADDRIAALRKVGNGVPWIFMPRSQREHIIRCYHTLTDDCTMMEQRYGDLQAEFAQINKAKESEIWHDFELHSADYYALLEELVPELFAPEDSMYGLP